MDANWPLETLGRMPTAFHSGTPGSSRECSILCYGDSLTVGYCTQGRKFDPYGRTLALALGKAGIACQVAVCGHSGHSVAQMVANRNAQEVQDAAGLLGQGLERILAQAEVLPELVLLMAGTNDLGAGTDPQTICADISSLHDICHSRGIPTLVIAPPPAPGVQGASAARRQRLARLLEWWAQEAAGPEGGPLATFVDPANLVPLGVADGEDGLWDWDGLHLAPRGSRLLGRELAGIVAPLLQQQAVAAPPPPLATAPAAGAAASGGGGPNAAGAGLECWRARPAEAPEAFLGDIEDDYARSLLSRGLPTRSLALLFLAPEAVPCVGQEIEVRLGEGEPFAAIEYATEEDGGLLACVPEVEGAVGLPWGGTAVEVKAILRLGESGVLVKLQAVSSVRLVARHPARKLRGLTVALVQEVPEWGEDERRLGEAALIEELAAMERLFAECGELQRRSGFTAAGDFASQSLGERTETVLAALGGVRLPTVPASQALSPEVRRAAAASHAAVAALSAATRVRFFCEPLSLLPRLRRAKEFLAKVQSLLCTRIAFRRAFEEEDPGS